ncbi:substrate-binding periplasmic protein [Rhizobium sp. SG2393]|uniref:substrate-binding periplasmic protein n=1 Tax=Rhizobium sp. SG2393 TaxID=3276279 RepID=UPI00366CAC11
MKRLAVFFLLLMAAKAEANPRLTFVTQEYYPLAFTRDGHMQGSMVDQIRIITHEAGVAGSIEIIPWARAYSLALAEDDHCVFGAAHTPKRDALFKWVEPLDEDIASLVRLSDGAPAPTSPEDAKTRRIGVQRGDFASEILAAENFTNLDVSTDFETTLRKLDNGRIDMTVMADGMIENARKQRPKLEKVMPIVRSTFGMACNKAVDDEVIARLNTALGRLIADGRQNQILDRYGMGNAR